MGCPGHLPPFFATLVLLEYTFLHAEDAGDRLEHLRDGGATVGGACHEVFLATPSNAEMALMIHVDLDVLEGACEIEDKQAVSLG